MEASESFHRFRGSFHGSNGSFHGSVEPSVGAMEPSMEVWKLPRKLSRASTPDAVVQETVRDIRYFATIFLGSNYTALLARTTAYVDRSYNADCDTSEIQLI